MRYCETETWVPMNDGVRLDVSVCVPDGAAPTGGWPAVLMTHGHGDAGSKASWLPNGRRYASMGYLAVCYSVRGQGNSEGRVFHMGARELFDLQDMVHWTLSSQPVHPNKLAVVGSSQGGWHAYMAAAHCPQVAMVVAENIFTNYAEFAVSNGCLAKWFFNRTMRRRVLTAGLSDVTRGWALSGEWDRVREWVDVTSPIHFVDRIRCPVFILQGWHDVGMSPNQALAMFGRLQVPKKLYIGGGGHDGQDDGEAQAVRRDLVDRWLAHWLKGKANGIMDGSPIVYARRPGWSHASVDAIPVADTKMRILYLRSGGKLSDQPASGPDTHANIANRQIDPDYGLKEAIYDDDMAGVAGALRREVTSFESNMFQEETEILGSPTVMLHVMSNATVFQASVDLYDVAPSGDSRRITRGHFGSRVVEPGRHVQVAFDAATIGYIVEVGHHLRVDVSNYDTTFAFPYFEPFVARLYHDNRYPSRIEIPVKPSEIGS